jgi:hypothetical protein
MLTMSRRDLLASSTKLRVPAVSRHWQTVSKAIQKLVVGVLVIKSEGVFPYETHYVLATDEEVERLVSLHSLAGADAKKADGRIRLVAQTAKDAQKGRAKALKSAGIRDQVATAA